MVASLAEELSCLVSRLLLAAFCKRRLSRLYGRGNLLEIKRSLDMRAVSCVFVGAILGKYGDNISAFPAAGWTGIAFIYIYDINFSYSFAPIGWVLPSEIFNLGNRSKAIAITTSTTWMCNFIIGLVTPDMLETITWGTYIFFAAFALIAFFFTYFFIPETKGKSLEDMDEIFGDTAAHEEKLMS